MAPDDGERLVLSAALQGALLQIERVADPKGFSPDEAPEALKRLMVEIADGALRNSASARSERRCVIRGAGGAAGRDAAQTRAALESVLGVPVASGPHRCRHRRT